MESTNNEPFQSVLEPGETVLRQFQPDPNVMPDPVPKRARTRLIVVMILLSAFFYLVNGGFQVHQYTLLFALILVAVLFFEFNRTVIKPLRKRKLLEAVTYAVTDQRIITRIILRREWYYSVQYYQILGVTAESYPDSESGDIILFTDQPNSGNPSSRWVGGMNRDTLFGIPDVKELEALLRDRMAGVSGRSEPDAEV